LTDRPQDYPVATPDGFDPLIYRAQIIAAMRERYKIALFSDEDDPVEGDETAFDLAVTTWNTEWPDDPAPRTLKAAMDVVDDDLHYWDEG